MVKFALAFAHTHFRGLFSYGFVRKNPNPELAAFMQLPGQDYADSLNLGVF
jgi:hypothetical protein